MGRITSSVWQWKAAAQH